MKAISLHQPWASMIAIGRKSIETRSWPTSHRGAIAIHAAKKWDAELRSIAEDPDFSLPLKRRGIVDFKKQLPFGAVIAVATLVDCLLVTNDGLKSSSAFYPWNKVRHELPYGAFSAGRWAWLLTGITSFDHPVPFRGHQQLFDVPDELLAPSIKGTPPALATHEWCE